MKKKFAALTCALALCVVGAQSSQAESFPSGDKKLVIDDCHQQGAAIQMPKSQAQSYLPKGFQPYGKPAPDNQDEIYHFWIMTSVCGDAAAPEFTMFVTYVSVDPPKKYSVDGAAANFILDMGGSGPLAKKVSDHMCLKGFVDAVIQSDQVASDAFGAGAGAQHAVTTISSESISATTEVGGAGPISDGGIGMNRWFYKVGSKTTFFDIIEFVEYFHLGNGAVAFDQPYRDLPQAQPGISIYQKSDVTMYRPKGCTG